MYYDERKGLVCGLEEMEMRVLLSGFYTGEGDEGLRVVVIRGS